MKKVRKKPKKTPVQRLEKEASILMGKWANSVGFCSAAGRDGLECTRTIQNAHIIRRSKGKFIRFSPLNCTPLCTAHHTKYDNAPHFMFLHVEDLFTAEERFRRLVDMDRWASKNCKVYFAHQELLERYITFYKDQAQNSCNWSDMEFEGFTDPIEGWMKEYE